MRHDVVQKAVLALAALLVLAALLFGWLVTPPARAAGPEGGAERGEGPASAGAELFAGLCANCHEVDEVLDFLGGTTPRAEATAMLLELLADHGRATDVQDVAIVDHLGRLAWERE